MSSRLSRRFLFLAVVPLAVLAACSSSSKTSSNATTSSSAPSTSSSTSSASTSSSSSASAASGTAATPADAVTGYFTAAKANDCPTAFALLTDPLKSTIGSAATLCQSLQSSPISAFTVGATNQSDASTATVAVTLTLGGGSSGTFNDAVTTLNVGGSWFVSAIKRQ